MLLGRGAAPKPYNKTTAVSSTHSALLWRYRSIWRSFHLHGIGPNPMDFNTDPETQSHVSSEMTFKPWVILVGGSKWWGSLLSGLWNHPRNRIFGFRLGGAIPEKIHPTNPDHCSLLTFQRFLELAVPRPYSQQKPETTWMFNYLHNLMTNAHKFWSSTACT